MPSRTIMLVDLAVAPSREKEFDAFYHDFYIPEFLTAVPEVTTARRFAQTNANESQNELVHYLTVYELATDHAAQAIDEAIACSAHREASDQFKHWKKSGLTYFDRAYYKESFSNERECATDRMWNHKDLLAMFWSIRPDQSGKGDQQLTKTVANELTTAAPTRTARTYEKSGTESISNYMTVLALRDLNAMPQTLSAAQQVFRRHANTTRKSPNLTQTIALQMIYSHLPDAKRV